MEDKSALNEEILRLSEDIPEIPRGKHFSGSSKTAKNEQRKRRNRRAIEKATRRKNR